MKRLWRQIIGGERGQALPIVLSVMIIGGLMIAPALNHISTSLNAGMMVEENVKGLYAAEAGVEDVLWLLTEGIDEPPEGPQLLPENVNQMEVSTLTEDKGTYTLYSGDLIVVGEPPQVNYGWLDVEGEMEPTEEEDVYKYTITVTRQEGAETIHLTEIGVRLPIGCEYVEDSADDFGDNLSTDEPDDNTPDWTGAYMLNWGWKAASRPIVSETTPILTQEFYVIDITGEGEREGDYTWAEGDPNSVGQLGEFTGTFYSITSEATRPEDVEPTATVVADVLVDDTDGEVYIVRWQINPE